MLEQTNEIVSVVTFAAGANEDGKTAYAQDAVRKSRQINPSPACFYVDPNRTAIQLTAWTQGVSLGNLKPASADILRHDFVRYDYPQEIAPVGDGERDQLSVTIRDWLHLHPSNRLLVLDNATRYSPTTQQELTTLLIPVAQRVRATQTRIIIVGSSWAWLTASPLWQLAANVGQFLLGYGALDSSDSGSAWPYATLSIEQQDWLTTVAPNEFLEINGITTRPARVVTV